MTQVYSINTPQVGELTGTRLADSYLQLVESQPGGLGVLPLPHLDAGPFLSYGIQWIAFGIVAPIGLGYFVYAEIQHRRRDDKAVQQRPNPSRSSRSSPTATAAGTDPGDRQSRGCGLH